MHVAPREGSSYWLIADRHTFKLQGADTNGAFMLMETVAGPDLAPPPHIHMRQNECFYVLDGTWEFSHEGRTFTAGAGAVVYLPKGQLHTHRASGGASARALVMYTPAGLEHFIEEAGTAVSDAATPPPPPTMEDLQRIVAIAGKHGIEVPPPPDSAGQ